MKNKLKGKAIISLTIVSLMILPTVMRAEKQKIKVVVEDASIRLEPDMTSEIIKKPSVGSVFEVEKKVGEWYEIRFPSEVGALITGYIHEMFVEVEEVEKDISEVKRDVIPEPPRKARIANIKVGLLVHLTKGYDYEYSFTIFNETSTISDSVDNDKAFGFDAGIGIFMTKNIEITGSINYLSKTLTGDTGFSLPNKFLYDDIADDEMSSSPSLREIIFSFGINLHPVTSGMIRPYFGGGVSYVMGKMDLVEDINYVETFYADATHSIEISSIDFIEEDIKKLGFNIVAGINFELANIIAFYGEGKYIIAKKEVPHPMISEFFEEEMLDIDLGGISFRMGIKLLF